MKTSLQHVLPEPVSDEVEVAMLEKMRSKMWTACSMLVTVVRAMEAEFGKDHVHRIAREALHQVKPGSADTLGAPQQELVQLVVGLEKGCAGTHEWSRRETTPDAVGYAFTSCMWADAFRGLDAADIGQWICEGDDAGARSQHPDLRCRLTKTLMAGDDHCNHVFHVAGSE